MHHCVAEGPMKDNRGAEARNGGEPLGENDLRICIIQRFRLMSNYSGGVPNEYSAHLIRQDLEKAGFSNLPEDDEIDSIVADSKQFSTIKVIQMIHEGKSVSEIREWCEMSPYCTIPIPPVGSLAMGGLLARFDYFNYELNRIVREDEINTALKERKQLGPLFDPARVERELEMAGYSRLNDDFTRVDTMSGPEIAYIVREAEERSRVEIEDYLRQDLNEKALLSKLADDPDVVFSEDELPQIISDVLRSRRFSIIAKEISQMGNSEMWNLINNIESYKVYRTSREISGKPPDQALKDNQMTEMMKLYEQSRDSLSEGYLFQISRLSIPDLTQLIRLIEGYIFWRGAFYYMPRNEAPIDLEELSKMIVDGFSGEHGLDPALFRMFLLRK